MIVLFFRLLKKNILLLLMFLLTLCLALLPTNAYAFQVVDQGISKMAPNNQDPNSFEKLTVFPQDWPILYYWVKYADAVPNDKLVARFQYIDQEPTTFSEISEVVEKPDELWITHVALNPGKSWPVGKYEIILLLNGKEVSKLDFEVK
ncbi:hypothetical protein Thena_0264 [Thermodesulfobium narugense DSM 14796]|uniref:Uncharacterized protein n=1 Tax=Thermodesulfobium narugense DSM 14796 TaxID=747365 RepID=M1E4A7_9BACT|nr:hypothetical protein [Thermodesulfobium narugense]AEE13912.1 hypothetical protein Thena_0264 [Thermodesulfobium narugense DSM 14796]